MDKFKASYPNYIETRKNDMANSYKSRMEFARDNNCNVVILTGQ
jgi:hypothetical protein